MAVDRQALWRVPVTCAVVFGPLVTENFALALVPRFHRRAAGPNAIATGVLASGRGTVLEYFSGGWAAPGGVDLVESVRVVARSGRPIRRVAGARRRRAWGAAGYCAVTLSRLAMPVVTGTRRCCLALAFSWRCRGQPRRGMPLQWPSPLAGTRNEAERKHC